MVKVLIDSRFPSICSTSDLLPVGGSGSLRGWDHERLREWGRTKIKQSRSSSASISVLFDAAPRLHVVSTLYLRRNWGLRI